MTKLQKDLIQKFATKLELIFNGLQYPLQNILKYTKA